MDESTGLRNQRLQVRVLPGAPRLFPSRQEVRHLTVNKAIARSFRAWEPFFGEVSERSMEAVCKTVHNSTLVRIQPSPPNHFFAPVAQLAEHPAFNR
jgi:hypothetical protein